MISSANFGAAEGNRGPTEYNDILRTRTTELLSLLPTLIFQMNIPGTIEKDRFGPKMLFTKHLCKSGLASR